MILLIDNYDSFSYNVYQLVGSVNPDIRVIRNDECSVDEIRAMNPSHIILSPGPGRPDKAGVCEEVIRALGGKIPILGICLGHQAICEVAGATVTYASHLMHGKQSLATLDTDSVLFRGMKKSDHCGKISFSGGRSTDDSRRIESYRGHRRRRGHGGRTDRKADLRSTVPSGIGADTGWSTDHC